MLLPVWILQKTVCEVAAEWNISFAFFVQRPTETAAPVIRYHADRISDTACFRSRLLCNEHGRPANQVACLELGRALI